MSFDLTHVMPLLEVFDMRQSVAFYCDKLGFQIVNKWEPDGHLYWAMVRRGSATLMLNSRYEADDQPAQPDKRLQAGHADAEFYFACSDVQQAYDELRAKGCDVSPPKATHYGMTQAWLTDPDGFKLCFQQPTPL